MAMTGDCKSPDVSLRRFESYLRYQIKMSSLKVGHFYLKLYDKFVKITEVIHMPR